MVAAFDNPNDAMRCAERYLFMLSNLYVHAYVAITWAMATARHSRVSCWPIRSAWRRALNLSPNQGRC